MNSHPSPDEGEPLGNGSPDVAPTPLSAVPTHPMPGNNQSAQAAQSLGRAGGTAGNEEPGLLLEPDLPSDGPDEVGEAMIRDLPQRPELSEPPSQPDSSRNTS